MKIAHRGAAGSRPEHTRPAFERAIELDVQLTRDRHLVVLHDRELGRTVRGSGAVRDHSLAELCAMDAGAWFEPAYRGARVMSLDEVLELTAGRVALNVEIKCPEADWAATAALLTGRLRECDRLESTIISCFDMGALHAVRDTAAGARLGVLWRTADIDNAWRHAAALGATSINLLWTLVDEAAVAAAHERGLAVIVWTVNDADAMASLGALGVDGIISDFPERFGGCAWKTGLA